MTLKDSLHEWVLPTVKNHVPCATLILSMIKMTKMCDSHALHCLHVIATAGALNITTLDDVLV